MSMTPKQLKDNLKGVVHLVMTPFGKDEEVDEPALRETTSHIASKLEGEDAVFLALGSTGEFYAMSDDECRRVAQIVVEAVDGRFPVIIGTSRAGTKPTIEMSRHAQSVGADGVMVTHPYYHLVTKEGLFRHYSRVADSIDIGIMVYNNPVTTKHYVTPDLMARLSKIDNIIADKENSQDALHYYFMQRAVDPKDMVVICGPGQLMYTFEALYGSPGYVTELANFVPDLAVALYKAGKERDFDKLTELADKIAPYHEFIGRVAAKQGPLPTVLSPHISIPALPFYQSVCKEAMKLVGLPGGRVRDPMESMPAEDRAELRRILKGMGAL